MQRPEERLTNPADVVWRYINSCKGDGTILITKTFSRPSPCDPGTKQWCLLNVADFCKQLALLKQEHLVHGCTELTSTFTSHLGCWRRSQPCCEISSCRYLLPSAPLREPWGGYESGCSPLAQLLCDGGNQENMEKVILPVLGILKCLSSSNK